MAWKKHTVEQIIGKLREAEVALSKGQTVVQASRSLGITEQTYYRWRDEYGAASDKGFGSSGGFGSGSGTTRALMG